MISIETQIFFLLIQLTVLIVAEESTLFPFHGNGSIPESLWRMESSLRPDIISSETFARPQPVPVNHFLPVPQRMFINHRSDNLPYVYEHPHFAYPVAHSMDYPVGSSSKPLVIVSFIGLMLLFAIIQNTMANVKRREMLGDVLSARKKRELYAGLRFDSVTPEQELVLDEDARLRCIQRTICLENRRLLKTFGVAGKSLAKYLTRGVVKSVKSASGWDRLVQDAGEAGTRGEDCEILYRDCEEKISSKDHKSLTQPKPLA